MTEPRKRIIVDGVEFGQLFMFPKILGAVTSALQPARLAIALFVIVALIAFGRTWDAVTEPSVSPAGLTEGRYQNEDDRQVHQTVLREALRSFATEGEVQTDETAELHSGTVLKSISRGYESLREQADTNDEREMLDQRYRETLARIHQTRPRGDFEATVDHISSSFDQTVNGVYELSLPRAVDGLTSMLITTPLALWSYQTWFAVLFGLFAIVALAIGGGAISRMAACQVASGERLSIRDAVDFAMDNWGRLIWALILPLLIVVVLCAVVVVLGLLLGAPVLDLVGGIAYGLALVFGFLISFLLIGYVLGFPLLLPAVACENCDGADAMQRAYAYTVTRPLHLLGYWAIALVGLALGFLLVGVVATVTLNLTAELYGATTNNPAMSAAGGVNLFEFTRSSADQVVGPWHSRWAATAIAFWQALVVCLIAAYVLSYVFSASTAGYLLMRRACDGQDVEEIWRPGLVPGTLAPMPEPVMPPAQNPQGRTTAAESIAAD